MFRSAAADLIRAFNVLAPAKTDDATRDAMARLLGLEWKHQHARQDIAGPGVQPPKPVASLQETGEGQRPPAIPDIPPSDAEPLRFQLVTRPRARGKTPDWLEQVEPFPMAAHQPADALPLAPLFRPDWTRGILSGALASVRETGEIDLPAIVESICRGEAIQEILRLEVSTLARGVRLLVDQSEAMLPFRRDQKWLAEQLERVAGKHAFERLNFIGCPAWGTGTGPRLNWRRYEDFPAPRTGTTVVVLTDLGITSGALRHPKPRPAEWVNFANLMRAQACPIVAFVPFARTRIPAAIQRALTVIQWDRNTSASRVRSIVGKGLK